MPLSHASWLTLTFKVVSESRVTWPTSVPNLVLGLSVLDLDLDPMNATDVVRRQTSDAHHRYNAPPYGGRGIIILSENNANR